MKNTNDTFGNRTRDLPTCSAVPQPTTLPRASDYVNYVNEKFQTPSGIEPVVRYLKPTALRRAPSWNPVTRTRTVSHH